ncbi:TonB-dependent receptor [Sphingomonas sp. PP-CE-1G-424]|uniref:TonB-dependent receptor n=1 Tax=Sphingomonas sp. PP-CE-1G-424 TaxID=2135658 RepID=UPI001056300C|nr:TonB-dependent receptor [Sphingomonas sp. PP-CE-1G-424]TCP71782.1 iron complex outermembrane receptor protein [Sphingomonas sp. PP-CE-1G-424]
MLNAASLRVRLLAGAALTAGLTMAIASPALAHADPAIAKDAAATAPAATPTDPADPAAAPAADPADQTGLGEIVVTATKRETNLQKTPIAINVLNSQALTDRHVQSLYDLADGAVPSLRVATFEARQSALTIGIRGIVPLDANQPAREQGVGIYIDGVYLGRQHGLNAALFDVDRIEVLKGPQGTLFGRNTEGGALSIVTKGPSGKWGGSATAGIANYGGYNGALRLDLPEVYGVSLKLDGVVQYQGATTKNPLVGQTGFNYYDRRGFKATARVHPISGMTADFSYDNGYDSNSPFYSQLLNFNPNACKAGAQAASPACALPGTNYATLTGSVKPLPSQVVINGNSRAKVADIGVPQQPSIDKTHGFTSNIRWDVAPEIELRSITAWRGVNATQYDNSGGYHRVPVVAAGCTGTACNFSRYSLADLHQNQFSQEFQAVGTVGQFDYVAGLYYFNEHISDDAATPNSLAFNSTLSTISVLDPCTGSGGFGSQPGCRSIDRASEVFSKSYAGYGQVTWNATDAIHLTAGGRYTRDEKQGVLHYSRNLNYDTATAAQLTAAGYKPLDASWNRFNPMATLAYDASDSVHLYAKYATGYRAGGASSRTSNYQTFNPEDVKSYEIGAKTDFWNHRARLNLAGYIMDRKNSQVDISSIQTTASGSFNNLVTINAPGITKIRGIEADLTVQPVTGLTLTAGYAYTYTKIPPVLIASTGVYQNFYIVFTPRNAANGSIDYTMPVGDMDLKFHLDGNYSQATQTFDQFATKNDPAFIANARLALANIQVGGSNAVTISAWVRNLFDKQYVFRRDPSNSLPGAPTTSTASGSISNVLGDYGNFNAPRTYGMEASVKF